ncbi:MAG: CvpA family protein [Clostridia bacterium]|nr:CvpA family protein [Clostridia bacterium]
MSLFVDLIFIAVFIFIIFLCYKRGFVRGLIETVGMILALIVAMRVGSLLGELTYDRLVEPELIHAGTEAIGDAKENTLDKLLEFLPQFVRDASMRQIIEKYADADVDKYLQENGSQVMKDTSQKYIKPTLVYFINMLYTLLVFVLLYSVVKLLARLLNKLFTFGRITDKINRFLGAVLGLPRGLIACALLSVIVAIVHYLYGDSFVLTSTEALKGASVYQFFISLTPFG